jgi:hypothetical protein
MYNEMAVNFIMEARLIVGVNTRVVCLALGDVVWALISFHSSVTSVVKYIFM